MKKLLHLEKIPGDVGEVINGINEDIVNMNKDLELLESYGVGIDLANNDGCKTVISQIEGKGYTVEDQVIDELFDRHFSKKPELTRLRFGRFMGHHIKEICRMDVGYAYFLLNSFPCTPEPEQRAIKSLLKEGA